MKGDKESPFRELAQTGYGMTEKKDMKNLKVKVWLGKLDLETLLGESLPRFCGFIKKKKITLLNFCYRF